MAEKINANLQNKTKKMESQKCQVSERRIQDKRTSSQAIGCCEDKPNEKVS
jgi:hypothetical protein